MMKIHNCDQYSDEWWSIRNGLPSGSKCKSIVTSSGKQSESLNDYAIELANDLFNGKSLSDFSGNKYTERGHEIEDEAALDYQMINQYSNDEFYKVGLITDDLSTYCSSPDMLVKENGILEIKCLTGKWHTKYLVYINKYNKCPTTFYAQIQMQLMVSDREWCDLYLYHPDLPSKEFRVFPDLKFFKELKTNILKVNLKKKEILNILNNFN